MSRGRPPGTAYRCSFCGENGHIAARDGATCSPSHLAVRMVLEYGYTQVEAAREFGIRQSTVSFRLAAMRRMGAA